MANFATITLPIWIQASFFPFEKNDVSKGSGISKGKKKRRKRKQALQKKELFSYENSDKLTTLITMQSTSQATHHRLAGNSYAQITDAPLEISLFCWLLSSDDHSSGEDSAIRKHLFKTVLLFMGAFLFVFFSPSFSGYVLLCWLSFIK